MFKIYLSSLIFWIVTIILSILLRKKRISKVISIISLIIFILFLAEAVSVIGLKMKTGQWSFRDTYNTNAELFEPHPYLIGVPRKDVKLELNGKSFSHNSDGFRGEEIPAKSDIKRIIAIGGSTTYGVGVSDNQTWPYYLDSILGKKYEVLNFGIPGHSTVENIILSTLIMPEYDPDIVLIHVGENDIRNINVANLEPDYSNYHAPTLHGALGFCYHNNLPRVAILKVGVLLMQKIGIYPICNYHKMNVVESKSISDNDYALKLFRRNLESLLVILKHRDIKCIMVPQVLVKEAFVGDKMKWWIPYISEDDLLNYLAKYNDIMKSVASESNTQFANDIINYKWEEKDFIDACHLCSSGNQIFAEIIFKQISLMDTMENKKVILK